MQDMSTQSERAARLAAVLGAVGHPMRLRIVAALAGHREYVSELARRLEMSRPLLHMHLKRLEAAGLVSSTLELSPQGKAMRFYEVPPFDFHLTPATLVEAERFVSAEPETHSEQETPHD